MGFSPLAIMRPPIMTLSPVPTKPRVLTFAEGGAGAGGEIVNFNQAVADGAILAGEGRGVLPGREVGDDR